VASATSRSSAAYLIEVLVTIARDLDNQLADMGGRPPVRPGPRGQPGYDEQADTRSRGS
jgi:hypothetical protein